eukprot:Clim_evm54s11 gene=Clim_evmTU54s11
MTQLEDAKEVPDNANEHCPGVGSEGAGKASACEGCPNKDICASAQPKGPDPDLPLIAENMKDVRRKIAVLSGKGGVGKSTVTSQLAYALAENKDTDIGVLDADITGPSIPIMFGVQEEEVHHTADGWQPIFADENIGVVSVGFLLPDPDAPVIWRGPKKNGMIKQFLRDVVWDKVDYMLIDTPPGTSDEHLSVVQLLEGSAGLDGAIIVTTPQEVSLSDVRKEIDFCHKVNVKILGVIENMSGFVCPKCTKPTEVFAPSTGGAKAMCEKLNVPFLGSIPLDPRFGMCGDQGLSIKEQFAESAASGAVSVLSTKLRETVDALPINTPVPIEE